MTDSTAATIANIVFSLLVGAACIVALFGFSLISTQIPPQIAIGATAILLVVCGFLIGLSTAVNAYQRDDREDAAQQRKFSAAIAEANEDLATYTEFSSKLFEIENTSENHYDYEALRTRLFEVCTATRVKIMESAAKWRERDDAT